MSFNFQPIDYSGLNDERRRIIDHLKSTMDNIAQIGANHQGWLERKAAEEKALAEAKRRADSLQRKKDWMNDYYGPDYDWNKYGPGAAMAYTGMLEANDEGEWQSNFNNLATAINMYEQKQQMNSEQEKAAQAKAMEDQFAVDMNDFNNQDWSQAQIGGQLYGQKIDPEIANADEIKELQKLLGIKATGKWDSNAQTAYNQARGAYDVYQQLEQDLMNKYGAKRFYDAMNEANQMKLLERAFQNNAKAAHINVGSGW